MLKRQCLTGTKGHESFGIDDSNLLAAGRDDAGPAQFGQVPGDVDQADAEDVGQVLLGQIIQVLPLFIRFSQEEQIEEAAQFYKGAVKLLVSAVVNK